MIRIIHLSGGQQGFDAKDGSGGAMKTEAATLTGIERAEAARRGAPAPRRIDETAEMNRIASDLKESADTTTAKLDARNLGLDESD